MNNMTRQRQNNRDTTKVQFLVSRIDGRASRGCPDFCPTNTQSCGDIEADRGKYCPDELDGHRREMNEPRRRPERDNRKDVELLNLHAESPI